MGNSTFYTVDLFAEKKYAGNQLAVVSSIEDLSDANLTEQGANLAPDDALVLYIDGVLEARSPAGYFFGEERLVALLRSSVGLDASAIAERVERTALNFRGQTTSDDIAVLVRVPN